MRPPARATRTIWSSANAIAFIPVLLIALVRIAPGQSQPVLQLQNTIELPGVQGRIDHMTLDMRGGRLFVAALGNNTVEVVDVKQAKRLHTIPGLHEPQGVLYVPDVNRLYVANGDTGDVEIFDGTSYGLLNTVHLGSDADNVRFDAERKLVYVGYGSGAVAVLREDGSRVANIKLDAHPESFQIEKTGTRMFVNLPDSRKVAVVDRNTRAVIANWSTGSARANFPRALDERNHRLFIVCRQPSELLVLNTDTGSIVAKLPAVADCDDVFYDSGSQRLYASGGDGSVIVIQQAGPDTYKEIARVSTRRGARTSFFSAQLHSLYVAARQEGAQPAAIHEYTVQK